MAIRNIIHKGDEVLNKKCKDVTVFDEKLHALLEDMKETMFAANGVGLAAPQIGILRRIAVVLDIETGEVYEIINPQIVDSYGEQCDVEGCLSLPNIFGYVTRPIGAKVVAQNRDGQTYEVSGEGFFARALFHEIDHLEGKLFDNLVEEYIDPEDIEV